MKIPILENSSHMKNAHSQNNKEQDKELTKENLPSNGKKVISVGQDTEQEKRKEQAMIRRVQWERELGQSLRAVRWERLETTDGIKEIYI